jgi:hypothetical protein
VRTWNLTYSTHGLFIERYDLILFPLWQCKFWEAQYRPTWYEPETTTMQAQCFSSYSCFCPPFQCWSGSACYLQFHSGFTLFSRLEKCSYMCRFPFSPGSDPYYRRSSVLLGILLTMPRFTRQWCPGERRVTRERVNRRLRFTDSVLKMSVTILYSGELGDCVLVWFSKR